MPIKSVKMKISKNKKMRFFLVSQGSFHPKIRFLDQKVCSVARLQTHRHTDRHTRKWLLWVPFQGFRSFSFNLSSRIGPICMFEYCMIVKNSMFQHCMMGKICISEYCVKWKHACLSIVCYANMHVLIALYSASMSCRQINSNYEWNGN